LVSAVPTLDGISLTPGVILTAPPSSLSVTFNKTVNFAELVRSGLPQLDAVYVLGSQGRKLFPSLVTYAESGSRATFLFPEALPNDVYQLHLSGPSGLADLAGNPLAGNDPSGDYVSRFAVNGPPRGSVGNPRLWFDQEPNDDRAHPQDLGVLFPAELPDGILVQRVSPSADAADTADYYRFRLVEPALLSLRWTGSGVASEIQLTLEDVSGRPIPLASSRSRNPLPGLARLPPGTYTLDVRGWSPAEAATVTYQLTLVGQEPEQAPL